MQFGRPTYLRAPSFNSYIFQIDNGKDFINLKWTLNQFDVVINFLQKIKAQNKKVLFIAFENYFHEIVKTIAERIKFPYFTYKRWLPGLFTNFSEIKKQIKLLQELQQKQDSGDFLILSASQRFAIFKQIKKMQDRYQGLKNFHNLEKITDEVGAIFIANPLTEELKLNIAVREAILERIPIIALCNTDTPIDKIDYFIPGNNCSVKSLRLVVEIIAKVFLPELTFSIAGEKKKDNNNTADVVNNSSLEKTTSKEKGDHNYTNS